MRNKDEVDDKTIQITKGNKSKGKIQREKPKELPKTNNSGGRWK